MEPGDAAASSSGEVSPTPSPGPPPPVPTLRPPGPDRRLRSLVVAAPGVVYGDIGTSPLYAIRECFRGSHGILMNRAHVLGVLSLIVWSLLIIPRVNYALLVATITLVLGFGSSSDLAAAYGVAVTTTMVITTVLASLVMRRLWHWPLWAVIGTTAGLLVVDLTFFGASLTKVREGGWFPLLIGGSVLTLMTTWRRGRVILRERLAEKSVPLDALVSQLEEAQTPRSPGMAVYMTGNPESVPPAILRVFRHLGTIHEKVILLTVVSTQSPWVGEPARYLLEELPAGFYRVTAYYGFMETPNIPKLLKRCSSQGLRVDLDEVTYVVGRETLLATERPGMALWRERLFALMSRNAGRATAFFKIPPDQVLEIGAQIEL